MKEYFSRIPFGQEQRLNLGFGDTCPLCDVQRGIQHEDGCPAEECPKCRRPVVGCFCECLEPWEELRIIKGIELQFTCLEDSRNAGAGAGNRKNETLTPTDKAALLYFMKNSSPETRAELDAGFNEIFPGLSPCGTNASGEEIYSSNDLAAALDMDKGEVNEMCRALVGDSPGTSESVATNPTFN
ncbi:MAG: hypothetical protein JZU65_07205 [Chlorobium sp.]|nr:hypothetical protein [Chlorobium sp.]